MVANQRRLGSRLSHLGLRQLSVAGDGSCQLGVDLIICNFSAHTNHTRRVAFHPQLFFLILQRAVRAL